MAERDFKGVWIPKMIYLDENLSWTEKILLVEIDSLDGERGCFALNEHFASHLGISKDRVSKLINGLVEKGYLTSEIIYRENSKIIKSRILHTTIGYSRKQLEGIGENNYTPPGENNQENNTLINNTLNNTFNIKKEKKKTEFDLLIESYTDDLQLRNTIYEFIKMRKAIKAPMTSNALKLMLNKLDRLAPNDIHCDTRIEILEQSIMNSWKGVFEIKEGSYGNNTNTENTRNYTGVKRQADIIAPGAPTAEELRRAEENGEFD